MLTLDEALEFLNEDLKGDLIPKALAHADSILLAVEHPDSVQVLVVDRTEFLDTLRNEGVRIPTLYESLGSRCEGGVWFVLYNGEGKFASCRLRVLVLAPGGDA